MTIAAAQSAPAAPVVVSVAGESPGPLPLRLSIVVPTFNEAGNVAELVRLLEHSLPADNWEAIFVDDNSPDGTADAVKAIAAGNRQVRCLHRLDRRGLAGACIEGILSSSAPYVAVIDGDLQHDERLLGQMLTILESGEADLVVGSRYVSGGSAQSLDNARARISRMGNFLARFLRVELSDPMSGFFMMRRDAFDRLAARLSPVGFKILLDIVTTAHGELRIAELPYEFRARGEGISKFDTQIALEFAGLLLAKVTGGVFGPRFLSFALVGASGLIVHLAVLKAALGFHAAFPIAQTIATLAALTGNFLLNNATTYSDRRLRGLAMVKGFFGFCAIGAVGALTNIGVGSWLYAANPIWWLSGLTGAIMGAVWNYLMSSEFVWKAR